jgi:hypothetical protein
MTLASDSGRIGVKTATSTVAGFNLPSAIRFVVRFAARGVQQVVFSFVLAEMCKQTIIMGDRKRIGSLFCLRTNRAGNRMAIRTEIRTRVDGP